MRRGEVWFAATPGGDRPVLVVALTRTQRGVVSQLKLTSRHDGLPSDCVANFDNVHTLARESFGRQIGELSPARMSEAGQVLAAAVDC